MYIYKEDFANYFEAFYKYSVDKKLHWPFAYEESIIDRYILDGKDNEYIYSELTANIHQSYNLFFRHQT